MSVKIRYATLTVGRNEEKLIGKTIQAMINQTIKPTHIVLVDDGSSDNTTQEVRFFTKKHKNLKLIIRRDRGYSALGTYLMADVYNTGMKYLFKKKDWDYLIIVGADTFLPHNYAEEVINRMGHEYGVAGGYSPIFPFVKPDSVIGSGRVIRRNILEGISGFPRTYGWEEGCLLFALYKGYKTGHFRDILFQSRLPDTKTKRNYIGWGRGMKDDGYHPLHAIHRSTKIIIEEHKPIKAIKLLVGFFSHPFPKGTDFIEYRRANYKHQIVRKIRNLLF